MDPGEITRQLLALREGATDNAREKLLSSVYEQLESQSRDFIEGALPFDGLAVQATSPSISAARATGRTA